MEAIRKSTVNVWCISYSLELSLEGRSIILVPSFLFQLWALLKTCIYPSSWESIRGHDWNGIYQPWPPDVCEFIYFQFVSWRWVLLYNAINAKNKTQILGSHVSPRWTRTFTISTPCKYWTKGFGHRLLHL